MRTEREGISDIIIISKASKEVFFFIFFESVRVTVSEFLCMLIKYKRSSWGSNI